MINNSKHIVAPIFIFSLPRSGSTLLQRLLDSKAEIATCSEPWVVLPLVYLTKQKGTLAEYSHKISQMGVEGLIGKLEKGRASYDEECGKFIRSLYSNIAVTQGAKYFLDKTPRYHLIIDEIMSMFPDGRFIFLWRNPLSIAASISNSWDNGKWNIPEFSLDIYNGISNLVEAYEKYHSRCIAISYEELVRNNKDTCDLIFRYLEIPLENGNHTMNDAAVYGRLGDKAGIALYSNVDSSSVAKWEDWVCNPIRKKWCNDYLNWIGETRLQTMGYSMKELKERLVNIHVHFDRMPSDLKRIVYGKIHRKMINDISHTYK